MLLVLAHGCSLSRDCFAFNKKDKYKRNGRLFTYKDAIINLNLIEGLGEFVVLEAEAPVQDLLSKT